MALAADTAIEIRPGYSLVVKTSFGFVALAAVCLLFADVSITTLDPWSEIRRMAWGVLTPDFLAVNTIGTKTVVLIAVMGFLMGRPEFLDLGLVYALINFIGTIAVLKFFEYGDLGRQRRVEGGGD